MRLAPARSIAAAGFLALQGAAIVNSRFAAARYFCWAPFDTHTRYELVVNIPGRPPLSRRELKDRYRLRYYGRDDRSPQHVIDIVSQYETTYGRADGASVTMTYSVNGRPAVTRRLP